MTRMFMRVCPVCSRDFNSEGNRAKYCPDCRTEGNKQRRKSRHYNACPECGKPKFKTSKLCQKCYGKTIKGENCPSWKGGRITDKSSGYILILTANGKYRTEHRIVWETTNKKSLPKGWVIHHINGVKGDNRPENLTAMPRNKHTNWTLLHITQKRIRELEQLHLPI